MIVDMSRHQCCTIAVEDCCSSRIDSNGNAINDHSTTLIVTFETVKDTNIEGYDFMRMGSDLGPLSEIRMYNVLLDSDILEYAMH